MMIIYTFFTFGLSTVTSQPVHLTPLPLTLTPVGSVACSLCEAGHFENIHDAVVTFLQ